MLVLVKYMFSSECRVRSGICVFIVVKVKCVNFGNMSNICDKLKFTTNYTQLSQLTHLLSKHTHI